MKDPETRYINVDDAIQIVRDVLYQWPGYQKAIIALLTELPYYKESEVEEDE